MDANKPAIPVMPDEFFGAYESWASACAEYNRMKRHRTAIAVNQTWERVVAIEPDVDKITDWEYATGRRQH